MKKSSQNKADILEDMETGFVIGSLSLIVLDLFFLLLMFFNVFDDIMFPARLAYLIPLGTCIYLIAFMSVCVKLKISEKIWGNK